MRIVTDSAADLSAQELKQLDVSCVSTQVIFQDGQSFPAMELPADELWQRLQAGEVVKTSQPTPADFADCFASARRTEEEAVCICVSSGVSGTVQSARLGAEITGGTGLHVVDSLTGTAGQQLLIRFACQLRDSGRYTAAQLTRQVESLRSRVRLLAGVDDMTCLARSGRIPRVLAELGSLTRLKPLLKVSPDGKIVLAGKAFGRHRAIDALARQIAAARPDPAFPVIPLFSCTRDNCQALIGKLAALGVTADEALCCAIGPSIAPHIGPGAFGAAFVAAE